MNVNLTAEEESFRDEVRAFLAEKYPADIREKQDNGIVLSREDIIRWQKILHEQGWFAVNWPEEYGGTGWTPIQKYIFANEMAAVNAPGIVPFGVAMVGPSAFCPTSWKATSGGARDTPSRAPAPILHRSRPRQSATAIITSLTAPKHGPHGATWQTGSSAWFVRAAMSPGARKASAFC
jgi:hypothetical protein